MSALVEKGNPQVFKQFILEKIALGKINQSPMEESSLNRN